jgi:hypothetical protein
MAFAQSFAVHNSVSLFLVLGHGIRCSRGPRRNGGERSARSRANRLGKRRPNPPEISPGRTCIEECEDLFTLLISGSGELTSLFMDPPPNGALGKSSMFRSHQVMWSIISHGIQY